eukprot:7231311-Prorocentrum_lima.AAC.1
MSVRNPSTHASGSRASSARRASWSGSSSVMSSIGSSVRSRSMFGSSASKMSWCFSSVYRAGSVLRNRVSRSSSVLSRSEGEIVRKRGVPKRTLR